MSLRLGGCCVEASKAARTKLRIKGFQGQADKKGRTKSAATSSTTAHAYVIEAGIAVCLIPQRACCDLLFLHQDTQELSARKHQAAKAERSCQCAERLTGSISKREGGGRQSYLLPVGLYVTVCEARGRWKTFPACRKVK